MTAFLHDELLVAGVKGAPEACRVVRFGQLAYRGLRSGVDVSVDGRVDKNGVRYIRTTDIASRHSLENDGSCQIPADIASQAPVMRGEILFCRAGATIGKSYLHMSDEIMSHAGYLVRFSPRDGVDSRFVSYWSSSTGYWNQVNAGRIKSTIENFSASRYGRLLIALPSLDDQRRIADYLDERIGDIDAKILDVSRLTRACVEANQALADEAFDRSGLLSNSLIPLKFKSSINPGGLMGTLPSGEFLYAQLSSLSADGSLVPEIVRAEEAPDRARRKAVVGDILIPTVGSNVRRPIGTVDIHDMDLVASTAFAVVRPAASTDWLSLILSSSNAQNYLAQHVEGAIFPAVSASVIGRMKIPDLGMGEQEKIARDAQVHIKAIREAMKDARDLAKLINEQKRAVIDAAVMGRMNAGKLYQAA